MANYYDDDGCCLTCGSKYMGEPYVWNGIEGEGCLCANCKCSHCSDLNNHECEEKYNRYKTWEDYEDEAYEVKEIFIEIYGTKPLDVAADFSNGTFNRTIDYGNPSDVPVQIWDTKSHHTLLLKEIMRIV